MVTDLTQFRERIARHYQVAPSSPQKIKSLEKRLGVQLPKAYREFLRNFGALAVGNVSVLGIGSRGSSDFDTLMAIEFMRAIDPKLPKWIVPIVFVDNNNVLCLKCLPNQAHFDRGPLLSLNIDDMPSKYRSSPSAGYFDELVYKHISEEHFRHQSITQLKKRVTEFNKRHQYDHAKGGDLPRNYEWRPYRFCIRDVLFGSIVVRHNRDGNYLQVDVFLPVSISGYEQDASTEALTVFLLSEAYKCGGSMEIRFTDSVEGGKVPASLMRIAERYNIEIAGRTNISPAQSRKLFAAFTNFSSDLNEVLSRLQEAGRLSIEKACYAVHHGIWSKPEVEMIIRGSQYPDSVLGGDALPERRHIYYQDLQDACGALLGGALDRRLAMRERKDALGVAYDLEDDSRDLSIIFDPDSYAKTYLSSGELDIPWLFRSNDVVPKTMLPNTPFKVLVRARDSASLEAHMRVDLLATARIRKDLDVKARSQPVFILVPSDFNQLGQLAEEIVALADKQQIGILVSPESMLGLADEASRRLSTSRITRDD